jgi:lipoate-protein ligase A
VTVPGFRLVAVHGAPLYDGIALEAGWIANAARSGEPEAHLWSGPPGFIVPRSYEPLPAFAAARAASAAAGWPVQVRTSGGGLVPQGPGVVNVSLIWCTEQMAPSGTETIYRELYAKLAAALASLGIAASAQSVAGSFCDGRFNLAVGGRKLAGTAQAWRRIEGRPMILAHAVFLTSADPHQLTEAANHFEALVSSGRTYRSDAITTVARVWRETHDGNAPPADLEAQLAAALARGLAG